MHVIMQKNKNGSSDLSFFFKLYFNSYSSYTHWMTVYYHCVKGLWTSFPITSAWTTFCPQKSLPLTDVILSLKNFRAFPISILLYILIALYLAVSTILETCFYLSIQDSFDITFHMSSSRSFSHEPSLVHSSLQMMRSFIQTLLTFPFRHN